MEKKETEERFGEIRIMWSAVFLSSIFYIIIGHLAADKMVSVTVYNIGLLKKFIYFLITVSLAASCYFRKLIMTGRDIMASESGSPENTAGRRQLPPVSRYRSAVCVAAIVANSTGMCGLGLFFYTGDFQILYTIVAVSAVFVFFHRPRKDEFDRLVGPAEDSDRHSWRENMNYIKFRKHILFSFFAGWLGFWLLPVFAIFCKILIACFAGAVFLFPLFESIFVKCPHCGKRPVSPLRKFPQKCPHCDNEL